MYTIIDGGCFKNMLIGAYQMFEQKYEILNQLNVFPVPDGDTGNNMLKIKLGNTSYAKCEIKQSVKIPKTAIILYCFITHPIYFMIFKKNYAFL